MRLARPPASQVGFPPTAAWPGLPSPGRSLVPQAASGRGSADSARRCAALGYSTGSCACSHDTLTPRILANGCPGGGSRGTPSLIPDRGACKGRRGQQGAPPLRSRAEPCIQGPRPQPCSGAKGHGHHQVWGLSAPSEPPYPAGAPTLPGSPRSLQFPGEGWPERDPGGVESCSYEGSQGPTPSSSWLGCSWACTQVTPVSVLVSDSLSSVSASSKGTCHGAWARAPPDNPARRHPFSK